MLNICKDIIEINNSMDFMKIYDGKRPYYGGNQKWFRNDLLRKKGCSIVAAANITAYIAKKIKNIMLYNYKNMSKENFLKHMEKIAQFIHPDVEEGVISISYFNEKVIEFSKTRGVYLKANIITTDESYDENKKFIKEALIKDNPIALLMLKNNKLEEFEWHWMTVTKIFENMNKSYLDFSTWGERRIFTLEKFYKFSTFGALSYFDVIK